ncbi:hypothetical protein PIROE2DRAFT_17260 [Piromyces sp. E2]|nr:hypothetical protein PIROE2DRAFT_17260 [Piromyces sp. E2]|eukprot:OUM57674.1 hypothetical protein PIROE2DRAFT_17260 [Piromyces sp. E2]
MNFKTISTILTILSLDLLAFSSPLQNKEYSADVTDISNNNEIEKSQNTTFSIDLTDKTEVIDISSEEEEIVIDDQDVEELSEIDSSVEDEENVCNTKECIEVSNNLLNSIDESVNPCEDFYQFACGNYIKNHPVSKKETIFRNFDSSGESNKQKILDIVKGDYKPNKKLSQQDQEKDKFLFNQLKSFFKSCVDVDSINKKGGQPMIDLLNRFKLDEMKDKLNDPNELAKVLAKIHIIKKNGFSLSESFFSPLFNMEISVNSDSDGFSIINVLYQSNTIIGYEKEPHKKVLSAIFKDSERDFDKMYDSAFQFDKKLLYQNNENNQNVDPNPNEMVNVKTLNEKYPNINWKTYLEEKYDSIGMKEMINDDTIVFNKNIAYIKNLNKIIGETDGETLANYLEMYIIFDNLNLLPEINDLISTEKRNREDYCVEKINVYMYDLVGKYFVEQNLPPSKKQYAEKVLEYIKQSMINRIPKVEWLDDETIEYAIKKVEAMDSYVGYTESSINLDIFMKNYGNLTLSDDDYFNNAINVFENNNNNELKYVKSTKDDLEEIQLPPQVII